MVPSLLDTHQKFSPLSLSGGLGSCASTLHSFPPWQTEVQQLFLHFGWAVLLGPTLGCPAHARDRKGD